jgi:sugar (pentulose or hexulose) kinase
MPPEEHWRAALEGTHAVLKQSRVSPLAVIGIGFSSQGQTFIPINSAGRPLYNAFVWVDNRAQGNANDWEVSWRSCERFHQISGYLQIPAVLAVFKVAWLARHAPDAHRAWRYLLLPDYLIYRLTGKTGTDYYITARMSGLFDLETGDWEPHLLGWAGVTREQLPVVLSRGFIAGKLLPVVFEKGHRSP